MRIETIPHQKTEYPLKLEKMQMSTEGRILRSVTVEKFKEPKTLNTFIGDATRLWN